MQAFNDIQELWQKHEVSARMSAHEMLLLAKKDINKIKSKSFVTILIMGITALITLTIPAFIPFNAPTTYLGILIIFLSIVIFMSLLWRDYRLLNKTDYSIDPSLYLEHLKEYQLNRFKLYNNLYWLYTIALILGLFFYNIEIFEFLSTTQKYLSVIATVLWIVFCSTFVRNAVINREKERIALLIERFERIKSQLSEN